MPWGGASVIIMATLIDSLDQLNLLSVSNKPQHKASGRSPPPPADVVSINSLALAMSSVKSLTCVMKKWSWGGWSLKFTNPIFSLHFSFSFMTSAIFLIF